MPWGSGRPVSAAEVVPDIVTVGGLTVDNVVAADGTVALAQAGGNGAYSAVGALFWCDRVGLVSQAVASYPRAVIDRLEAGGVDLGGVVWTEARLTSCNWFIYDARGQRKEGLQSNPEDLAAAGFPTDRLSPDQVAEWRAQLARRFVRGEVSYSQSRVANPLRPSQVPERFLGACGVHLAPSQPDVMLAMIDLFSGRGMTLAADPGWQLAAYSLDAIAPILARLDAFLPSEVELQAFVPGARPADGLAALAEHCPGALAVKLGPQGVLVWDRAGARAVNVPAVPAATLDPTGAGDAFSGGFIAGLVQTRDPVQAALFGAISASRIVERFGADGAMPLDRRLARAALASFMPSLETTTR
jgi:sugar/nucleoside kinase (ribokinase family)